ncbi:hypothetical protein [Sphingobium sp. WCS2017Hpa-17]|uniref:hypothetical protein n=1 Tax=Sphingobium sp. WCS2017Hpa-17 TaxID=3073638 RepID=UPI00288A206E|nr:hypothetical protein [Sphingobium sp. WCS2017Hpa-17]
MNQPHPFDEWNEAYGEVIWWLWPIEQAPYVGSPLNCGHTVEMEITAAASDGHRERGKMRMEVGGWPWRDADEETEARLFWTPLPDANALDEMIRDHIRGGPDPLKPADAVESDGLEEGRVAIDVLISSLSAAQRKLLARLQPARGYPAEDLRFTYAVQAPGNGLQTCAALARRQMVVSVSGGEHPFENRGQGHVRLTALGALIQKRIRMEAAHV